ncbi:sensor histidine kinase [Brevibacillus reuszeri]|uniref:sensor histidine kinase n=1 Tax=Brevibacillus reuszeri TaxID=54915 RepID=UPI00289AA84D|nr:HAMP domain-containing sensor histidine kinase [Brevibacillus reuszeri]
MDWEASKGEWLGKLLSVKEKIVELHMREMLAFGEPISRYYRKYQKQQQMGIQGMLTEAFQQLFSTKKEYEQYLQALSAEAYIWGERWAQKDIPKEVLLEVLFNLRQNAFNEVSRCCEASRVKEALLSRLFQILNVRYHHTLCGYLASKDQMISHLHQQKIGVIGQMAAGMAHEIRNPLAAVHGFLQLMNQSVESESEVINRQQFAKYIQICQHEVQTLEQLVTSFLILARKNEQLEKKSEAVDLRPLLEHVHNLAKHYVIEKDVFLTFQYEEAATYVWAIPSHVEQICLNLIKNALDAVAVKGKVSVSTRFLPEDSYVSVMVEDNGCGISEQRLKHLFEPFYTTKEKGTGIGLSVCKKLIEEMNGKIVFESKEGIGTKVEIRLTAAYLETRHA